MIHAVWLYSEISAVWESDLVWSFHRSKFFPMFLDIYISFWNSSFLDL